MTSQEEQKGVDQILDKMKFDFDNFIDESEKFITNEKEKLLWS